MKGFLIVSRSSLYFSYAALCISLRLLQFPNVNVCWCILLKTAPRHKGRAGLVDEAMGASPAGTPQPGRGQGLMGEVA